ncbi:MAG: cyanophycin synthetase [Anaerolineae bacterium]|nr:cyanophycin synthetase [Anaerolineae bacterium]
MNVLRGPNLYSYKSVLHIVMDIGRYENHPSSDFPSFVERLTAWLPGLQKHECSVGRPGGFIERLQRGTYLGHIVEHITLELQTEMGFDVGFGRARGTGEPGVYNVIIAYLEEEPAKAAFEVAFRLTLAAMHDHPFDFAGEMEALLAVAEQYRLGPSTQSIVKAARSRDIPVMRLTPQASLVQLGYGVYQKRIQAAETSNTSAIAVSMCQDKPLTNRILRTVGVPVPEGRTVGSADEAWKAAQAIGLPVVTKPEDGNQGRGVSVNLEDEAQVREGYTLAAEVGSAVLVEQYIDGYDFRLLVINGKLVAASRRDPAHVIGDGHHTIAELVEAVNQDPRRRDGHASILTRIVLDEGARMVLAQQKLNVDSTPELGEIVQLRKNSNLSTGGTASDVTDEVHPHNVHIAELAAQIMALDVAGIDIVCRDIGRPLAEQGGAVVEVNAAPGLRMHLHPLAGKPRDVGGPIVDMLYPEGQTSRIPIIAVTGTNGKTTVTRLISHMYETARWVVGMTTTEGTYINKERILTGDCSGPNSARAVLLHPRVEVAVLETARGGILREGLGFDWCSVGIVTNISPDHLGLNGINTLHDLARVKQVVIQSVSPKGTAILNADDPLVAEMAAETSAEVIYFALKSSNHIITAHRAEGGRSVYVEDGAIILETGSEKLSLVELERVEFTVSGKLRFQVQNALAATAAAWAAGLNPALIVRALTTFATTTTMVPGRFNRLDIQGVEVILDYGHNLAAMQALGDALEGLGQRRTVMVMGLPGDRRDEDIFATIEATLGYADVYVLPEQKDVRGRRPMEVPQLLQSRLPKDRPYQYARHQIEGIQLAWQEVSPGDRLLIILDEVDEAIDIVNQLHDMTNCDGGCDSPLTAERSL